MAGAGLAIGALSVAVGGVGLLGAQAHAAIEAVPPKHAPPKATSFAASAIGVADPAGSSIAPPAPSSIPPIAAKRSKPAPAADERVSARDLECLAAAVYYEARGEAAAGQAAVAQVVLNRARTPSFPKNVCGVVYQGARGHECQFSFVCDGAMRRAREPAAWTRARDVAGRALHGYVMAAIGKATCFHAARLGGGGGRVVRLGGHVFFGGAGRGWPASAYRTVLLAHADPARPERPRPTFPPGVPTPVSVTTPVALSPAPPPNSMAPAAAPPAAGVSSAAS
ncbi:MAG: cell wall hydrolase [Caulobacteraceae bacterium]